MGVEPVSKSGDEEGNGRASAPQPKESAGMVAANSGEVIKENGSLGLDEVEGTQKVSSLSSVAATAPQITATDKEDERNTGRQAAIRALLEEAHEEISHKGDEPLDGIQPLPVPTSTPAVPSLPGAYASVGFARGTAPRQFPSPTRFSSSGVSLPTDTNQTSGLPEATPVEEEDLPTALEEGRSTQTRTANRYSQNHGGLILSGAILMVIVIAGVVLGVTSSSSSSSNSNTAPNNNDNTLQPEDAAIPQALQSEFLTFPFENEAEYDALTNFTLAVLEADHQKLLDQYSQNSDSNIAFSPQYRAYQWLQNDPWLAKYSEARQLQRFSLVTFYYATTDDNNNMEEPVQEWTTVGGGTVPIAASPGGTNPAGGNDLVTVNITSNPWLSYEGSECDWFSMALFDAATLPLGRNVCNADDIFQVLSLRFNGLAGALPQEIGFLKNLTVLDIWRNTGMRGPIVSQIGQLQQLEVLNLEQGMFTGTLPSELGLLSASLQSFRVVGSNLLTGTIPDELWQLTTLTDLRLGRTQLSGSFPPDICVRMPQLQILFAGGSRFSGELPPSLGLCTDLKFLTKPENQYTGPIPSEVGLISSLMMIRLEMNLLSGALPSELGLLPRLRDLNVQANANMIGTFPLELKNLNNTLTALNIEGTSITGTIPSELCGIEEVNFDCSDMLCGCACPCQ